jgi:hypothetical protein
MLVEVLLEGQNVGLVLVGKGLAVEHSLPVHKRRRGRERRAGLGEGP